jgi:menaquinone-dependent protoporphyrinogen oxidase
MDARLTGDGMSKVLVVYGTKTGCTAGIAEKIGETLVATGATVDVKSASDRPSPADYDAIIVGSGVRASNWHGAVKEWVTSNADALKAKPTAFFTACLTMAQEPEKADEVRAYTDPLIAASGVTPVDIGLFAGMCDLKKFSLPERLIMKMMKAPEGDFRDFDAVAAWTVAVAPKLGVG